MTTKKICRWCGKETTLAGAADLGDPCDCVLRGNSVETKNFRLAEFLYCLVRDTAVGMLDVQDAANRVTVGGRPIFSDKVLGEWAEKLAKDLAGD